MGWGWEEGVHMNGEVSPHRRDGHFRTLVSGPRFHQHQLPVNSVHVQASEYGRDDE